MKTGQQSTLLFLAIAIFCCPLLFAPPNSYAQESDQPVGNQPTLVFSNFDSLGLGQLFHRILDEAYDHLGYVIEIRGAPAQRALALADDGNCDGIAARVPVIEKQYKNLLRVPTHLYQNTIVAFSRNKNINIQNGWESLRPYRCGSVNGYKYIESRLKEMDHVFVRTYEDLFQLLVEGRIDIAVTEHFDAMPTLKRLLPPGLHVLSPPLVSNPMYHYLNKRHADLVPVIDSVFQQMRNNGRLDAIREEMEGWYGPDWRTVCPCQEDEQ